MATSYRQSDGTNSSSIPSISTLTVSEAFCVVLLLELTRLLNRNKKEIGNRFALTDGMEHGLSLIHI